MIDALNSSDVPNESAGRDIQAQSRLPAALRAIQRGNDFSRRVATVYFAHQMNARAERIAKRRAVEQLVILGVERVGRGHNLQAQIAKGGEPAEVREFGSYSA